MAVSREDELVMVKMINFANEFLRLAHDIKKESDREVQLPDEIQEYLANEHLDQLMKDDELDPEMLVWGLVNIIEIMLKFTEMTPDQLTQVLSVFVKDKREELNG